MARYVCCVCLCDTRSLPVSGSGIHAMRALSHPRWEDFEYERLDKVGNRFYWLGDGQTVFEKTMEGNRECTSGSLICELTLLVIQVLGIWTNTFKPHICRRMAYCLWNVAHFQGTYGALSRTALALNIFSKMPRCSLRSNGKYSTYHHLQCRFSQICTY